MPLPRLIPCLDVAGGRVVKGVRFEGLRDVGDPVELGAAYSDAGADELVYLDVKATLEGRSALLALVARIADRLAIPFTVGGGVRSVADAEALLEAGADKVSVNTAALERPELVGELAAASRVAGGRRRGRRDERPGAVARRVVAHRPARGRLGARGRGARRGRDPADVDRRRRHARRLRPRAHRRRVRRGVAPGHRVRRRGSARHVADALEVAQAALLASILHENPARLETLRAELRELGVPLRDAA